MGAQIAVDITLATINCGECGGTYAINERYREQQHKKGGSWTCPYCETGWGYSGNSENERLKRELEDERRRKDAALAEANSLRVRNGQLSSKIKKSETRASAGVCPCCTRTFSNMARHMKTKHPDYACGEAPQGGAK